jgi:hypothetical protein
MGNICTFPHILGSPSSYICLCNCSTLNFLKYEENLISFLSVWAGGSAGSPVSYCVSLVVDSEEHA